MGGVVRRRTPSPAEYDIKPGDGNLPVPDPTRLTTQLVDRAIMSFREVVEARFDSMDKATKLIADNVDESKTLLQEDFTRRIDFLKEVLEAGIMHVRDTHSEKFTTINTQFRERDERAKQGALDSKVSLDAALAAQKEAAAEAQKSSALAIGKSEDATKEALRSQAETTSISIRSLEKEVAELRSRLDRAPGENAANAKTEKRADLGQVMVAISLILLSLGLVISAFALRG